MQTLARSLFAVLLLALTAAPALAQEPPAEAPPAAEAAGQQAVSLDQIPRADAAEGEAQCAWPTELTGHAEPEGEKWSMQVSVRNPGTEQQVPGLDQRAFQVLLDGALVPVDSTFEVRQSANAPTTRPPEDGTPPVESVDPISYDVYFAVDMTESMGDEPGLASEKPRSKLTWALMVIHNLVQPSQDRTPLFGANDRIYISGFTNKLETGFMTATSVDRQKVQQALADLNEFQPKGTSSALYASILHSLTSITAQAAEYSDASKKREAVLIIITDSFNGVDLDGSKSISRCYSNDPLTEQVRQKIAETRQATGDRLKVFLLGLGTETEPKHYSLTDPPSRYCRINRVEKETLDARSFRAIAGSGYVNDTDPRALLKHVKEQFQGLRWAYELTYPAPEGVSRPQSFQVVVTIDGQMCLDEMLESSNVIPQATVDADTSAAEVALFLAGLILALFFVPRSLVNLANLGSGGSPEPKKKPARGKKKKKRRR